MTPREQELLAKIAASSRDASQKPKSALVGAEREAAKARIREDVEKTLAHYGLGEPKLTLAPAKANGDIRHKDESPPITGPEDYGYQRQQRAPKSELKSSTTGSSALQFDRLSDIEPEAITWIWPGRIARRKLTLFGGDPGKGKSQIGIDIGARITRADSWPDDGVAPLGSVIVLSAEDSTADTVRPRFEAAGADLSRVHVLKAVVEQGKRRTFNLQRDLAALGAKIDEVGDVMFVIIDPLTAYMGKVDGHQTTDVRAVLEPVSDFADRFNVAVLAITHPPKNAPAKAINAFTGSLAFVATARLAFVAIEDPGAERNLLLPVKNNLGTLAPGLGYRLEQTIITNSIVAPRIAWDSAPVTTSANEALAASATGANNSSALADAKEFLAEELASGPVAQGELKRRAHDADISEVTLRRAKKALGVIAAKGRGSWTWELPQNPRRRSSEDDHSPLQ
jgi:putative DNA primase/helicase